MDAILSRESISDCKIENKIEDKLSKKIFGGRGWCSGIFAGGTMWIGHFSPYLIAWVFTGFSSATKTGTSFLVFSPLGFLASKVIRFALLRNLGFTARINKLNNRN